MKMQILIIDLGSQYTLVIARLLREMGYRSLILSSAKANSWLKKNSPQAIILSGGSASVYEKNSPTPPKTILNKNIPLLGICYGMQWLTKQLGGKVVAQQKNREYGENEIIINNHHDLFYNLKQKKIITWASHGDSVKKLPPGFKILATATKAKTIEAIGDKKRRIWGLQFHPEVTHTQQGKAIIKNFIAHISHCQKDWQAKNISNYSYDISWSCFCDKSLIRAVHIEVKNAKVVSRRYLNGKGEIPQAYYRFFGTIDELIKILKEAEAQNAHKIDIKWNPAYHYPESSHIDYIKDAVDDEQSFTITDFKVK